MARGCEREMDGSEEYGFWTRDMRVRGRVVGCWKRGGGRSGAG